MVTVKINGKEITVDDGTLILHAARAVGYEIPTFCYQEDLIPVGSCRMCLVEIEGQKKLQPSCITPVMHGMSIHTETPAVTSARASMLEFLLANHALDCPVCDKGGECELQDMVYRYGPRKGRHEEKKFKFHEKDYVLSPVIIKNSNRCVQCMKCVRVCREVVGANVLDGLNRGDHQEPTSFLRTFLDCDQDGNCIEVCPVGCFMRLPYRYKTRPWDLKGADTVCPYCATGCRMVIEERDGTVIRSRAQLGVGLNSETLCARGRFGYDIVNNPERLKTPLIRKFGRLEPASWEEALDYIRENLSAIRRDKIGGIASPRLTNEELFLFQKLFREAFGSPHVDSTTRFSPVSVESFVSATGMAEGAVSVFDCMEADTVLVIGSQVSEENPVTDYIIRRIANTRMNSVVVASPRAMKLDKEARLSLRHTPGRENAVLEAMALSLLDLNPEKLSSLPGISRLKGRLPEALRESGLDGAPVEAVSKRINASNSVSIMAGTDFLRFAEGTSGLGLLRDVLGALGKKVLTMPVLDRCNQRGAWEMGVHPSLGPGYREAEEKGLGFEGMLRALEDGSLDALYVIGEDVIADCTEADLARSALSKARFLIVQEMFFTETAEFAHCVLPGASFAEKEGTFTNQEGRVQAIKRLLKPPGKARADLDIIRDVGRTLLSSWAPDKRPSSIFEKIRVDVPSYRDVSLAFNNRKNYENRLDIREALVKGAGTRPSAGLKPAQEKEDGFPFRLVTGNHLFHSGRLSRRSQILLGLLRDAQVEMAEEDASGLGLKGGDRVRVAGRHFEATMTLVTRPGTKRGVVFIAENWDVPVRRFFRPGYRIPGVSITKE